MIVSRLYVLIVCDIICTISALIEMAFHSMSGPGAERICSVDMSKLSNTLAQESKGYAKRTDSLLRQVGIKLAYGLIIDGSRT